MWPWIMVILTVVSICVVVFYVPLSIWLANAKARKKADNSVLYEIIENTGYSYDSGQDIFYSKMNPWQREMGYCRLYDEASAPLNMIIDCEPVYFEYDNRKWMIEFWKGQYGMATGSEIGVYTAEGADLNIPGLFTGTFYNCAADNDRLDMLYTLYKNGQVLYERAGRHWWLTGFKLGEFSEPDQLTMHLTVILKDSEMCDAFVNGLKAAGYSEDEFDRDGKRVILSFEKPHTPQPMTRIPEIEWVIQRKNEVLCDKYQEITKGYDKFPDKLNAVREKAPELYDAIMNIGKSKILFKAYEEIKNYLN